MSRWWPPGSVGSTRPPSRASSSAGAGPPSELAPNVVVTYGMTETGSGVVYDGVPLDDVEVALAPFRRRRRRRRGRRAGPTARYCCGPPMLMRCTAAGDDGRVVGPDGTRTWFATGDAGYLTEQGTWPCGAGLAEVIVTGGEKVWPDAVERVLAAHRDVAEVAVWKRPDPEWGERVVAWVVPASVRPPDAESSPNWSRPRCPHGPRPERDRLSCARAAAVWRPGKVRGAASCQLT